MSKSLDGVLTKKANTRESFTEQQIADLKACADSDTGYLYFCNHFFNIQHPVEGKMLFEPFDYQERLLESYHNHSYVPKYVLYFYQKFYTEDVSTHKIHLK